MTTVARIVAFYTPDYADEIAKLKTSASEFELSVDARAISTRSWHQAVVYKPHFILEMLEEHPAVDGILYTDADSRFKRYPDFGSLAGVHFAAHWFKRSHNCDPEILTGTLWFAQTPTVKEFVREWIDATPKFRHSDTPEQRSLSLIWPSWKDRLIWKDFGPEWVWIFDDFEAIYPGRKPVIEHLQASRRVRK